MHNQPLNLIRYVMLALLSTTCLSVVGCASWDDQVAAPENFRSSYISLHGCKESAHPAAEYVITYLSPNAQSVWDAYSAGDTDVDFEPGTVSVKVQYSDDQCSDLTGYTVMEKTSADSSGALGGWRWQYLNESGECNDCDAGSACVSCHTPCMSGPAYFCTQPESM